ncbi:MAG: hypothetical protein VR65_13655 [Desulfobulbaceae bacterium BRH_c16a]|nr:MAG: hypothetical protein VR65_13655 [Desulfobulbaceae bacterium BRH_c16a]
MDRQSFYGPAELFHFLTEEADALPHTKMDFKKGKQKNMKTIRTVLLLSLLVLVVSSCARGYDTSHSGHYGSTQVYERMSYPSAVFVGTPYRAYSRTTYVGVNSFYYPGGGMGGGGMH